MSFICERISHYVNGLYPTATFGNGTFRERSGGECRKRRVLSCGFLVELDSNLHVSSSSESGILICNSVEVTIRLVLDLKSHLLTRSRN